MNDDGTAKDPIAFREALKADPMKMEEIEKEPEVAKIILGDDVNAFQELIKSVYHVRRNFMRVLNNLIPTVRRPLQAEKKRQDKINKGMAERTIDAQRVSATVPRYGMREN